MQKQPEKQQEHQNKQSLKFGRLKAGGGWGAGRRASIAGIVEACKTASTHFNSALELQQDTGLVWMAQRLKHKVKTRATQTHMPQSCCGEKQSCGVDYEEGLFHSSSFSGFFAFAFSFLPPCHPCLFASLPSFFSSSLPCLFCLLLPSDPPSFLPSFFPSSLIPSFCSCGFNFPRCSQKCFFDPPKVLIDPQKIFDTYPQIINGWITTKLTPSNVPKHQSTSIPPRCFLCPPHVSRSVPGRSSPLRLPRHRPQRWCVSAVGRRPRRSS